MPCECDKGSQQIKGTNDDTRTRSRKPGQFFGESVDLSYIPVLCELRVTGLDYYTVRYRYGTFIVPVRRRKKGANAVVAENVNFRTALPA